MTFNGFCELESFLHGHNLRIFFILLFIKLNYYY